MKGWHVARKVWINHSKSCRCFGFWRVENGPPAKRFPSTEPQTASFQHSAKPKFWLMFMFLTDFFFWFKKGREALTGVGVSPKPCLHASRCPDTFPRPSVLASTRPNMTARYVCRHVFFNMAAHGGEAQMGFDFLMALDGHEWYYCSWQAAPRPL